MAQKCKKQFLAIWGLPLNKCSKNVKKMSLASAGFAPNVKNISKTLKKNRQKTVPEDFSEDFECSGIKNVYFEDKFEDGWRMDLNFTLDMGVKLW